MLFMVLNMAFKSMAEKLIISPVLGAWAPCIILFPIGVWLTYRAMTDAKVMNLDRIIGPLQIMVSRIQKRSGGANKEV
jgi:lipopolysaccharide export system permease protein